MKKTITGLLYEKKGQEPKKISVKNSLRDLQNLIGGHIEAFGLPNCGGAIVICDEEGKMKGLEPTRGIKDRRGRTYDILVGKFFVCGQNGSEFDSLSTRQAELVAEYFKA